MKQLNMIGCGLAVAAIGTGAFFSGVNFGESNSAYVDNYTEQVIEFTRENDMLTWDDLYGFYEVEYENEGSELNKCISNAMADYLMDRDYLTEKNLDDLIFECKTEE